MKLLQLFLGQIPEAIFLALFIIYSKNLKEKRVLFTFIMIVEYLLVKYTFQYDWMFHILYIIMSFITLKILYKEKSQIIDVFIFALGYIIIILTSIFCFILLNGKNVILGSILNRIMIFVPLFVLNYKLTNIQKLYKKYWDRNDKIKKKMKSVTFRSLNIVIFNLLFYFINAGMLCALLMKGGM